ncbi:MAG: hypothetical protein D6770_04090 [Anaerolineae bacterium]|nr:MAG: hypothetical protein D6770_04090 [Anaerolineae bacterium]
MTSPPQKLACITLDVEADLANSRGRIRLFDEPDLLERYVRILEKHDVRLTAFLVTSVLERYGADILELAKRIPTEFGVHSHRHDPRTACTRAEIRLAVQTFREFLGKDPAGFRAPIGAITAEGLHALMDYGFRFDSSLYPSIRFGKNGYWNPHMPIVPFRVTREGADLMECPITALPTVRVMFALSYVKLLGWRAYRALLALFPLPDMAVFLSHPHDLYRPKFDDGVRGLEKRAILRNAQRGMDIFERVLIRLQEQGYRFVHMGEMCAAARQTALRQVRLARGRGAVQPFPSPPI